MTDNPNAVGQVAQSIAELIAATGDTELAAMVRDKILTLNTEITQAKVEAIRDYRSALEANRGSACVWDVDNYLSDLDEWAADIASGQN